MNYHRINMTEKTPRTSLLGAVAQLAARRIARHVHERYIQHPQGVQNLTRDVEVAKRAATTIGQEASRRGKGVWNLSRGFGIALRNRLSGKQ